MRVRSLHRIIGIILLVPFFGWSLTGLVFFFKPGYAGAYETLSPKTYGLDGAVPVTPEPGWSEFRYVRTVLGDHLIARTDSGWVNLDPMSKQPRTKPTEAELRRLLKDAFSANPQRYGDVASVYGETIKTSTDVEVTLDWNTLSLHQKGTDTDRIDLLYRIHYLQWTGVKRIDKVVGLVGPVLVMLLTTLGASLAVKRS
jgi:hypothetical protein